MPKILAVVVTFNALPWIDRCLESLKESTLKPDIFVVDNYSLDGTAEYVPEHFAEVIFRPQEENIGFGAANNLGFRYALDNGYDFVYLMNQDAWVQPDTLEKLVAACSGQYAVLSPVQTNAKGRKMDKNFERKCKKYLKAAPSGTEVVQVPFVMAAHWLVGIGALKTVGGFSPAFKQYGEDDNWIHRASYFGFDVGVVPAAKAVHDRAKRTEDRERKLKVKCVSSVVRLSNPSGGYFGKMLLEPLRLLGMTVWNFSLIPVKTIPSLVKRYRELGRLREASRTPGAFLTE